MEFWSFRFLFLITIFIIGCSRRNDISKLNSCQEYFPFGLRDNSACHCAPVPLSIWPFPHSISLGDDILYIDDIGFSLELDHLNIPNDELYSTFYSLQLEWEKMFVQKAFKSCLPFKSLNTSKTLTKLIVVLRNQESSFTKKSTSEIYNLTVVGGSQPKAVLSAESVLGLLRGWSTFKQMLQSTCGWLYIPQVPVFIHDQPRFTHRGLLLDTSRHFFPIKDILRTLDGMAATKLNVFHWHLVDSNSFPVESKRLPNLTRFGALQYPEKIYTVQDVRKVVAYAAEKGIRVIPEFDMPGHTYSWGLGYPGLVVCPNMQPDWENYAAQPPSGQLDPTQPQTYELVEVLLEEMSQYFSDSLFHVGGDEVNMNCWESSAVVKNFMIENKITSSIELLSLFHTRVAQKLNSLKKTMVVWEESVLEYNITFDPSLTLVQVWKGSSHTKKVAKKGYMMVVSPYDVWYLDCGRGSWTTGGQSWCDPYKSWVDVYLYEPYQGLDENEALLVIGGEVALWTELVNPSTLDGTLWPRLAAGAEVLWSPKGTNQDVDGARVRLFHFVSQLEKMGIGFTPFQPEWCSLHPSSCRFKRTKLE